MTEKQFKAAMFETAKLCKKYNIPVSPTTTLSHAEVEKNLGKKQRGKWDFVVLPFHPKLRKIKSAKACGDYAREMVSKYLKEIDKKPHLVNNPNSRIAWLQRLLTKAGFPTKDDGLLGKKTRTAIEAFQTMNGLSKTGKFDVATVTMLKGEKQNPVKVQRVSPPDKPAIKNKSWWQVWR